MVALFSRRPMNSPFSLVIALAFLFVVGGSALANDRSHLSSDPRVNEARVLIDSGRHIEALQILRPLAPNHPDRTDVLFLVGLSAMGASQLPETLETERTSLLDEAIFAFHAILVEQPSLVRVRLELARAFFLKGDDNLSRSHFERVLAGQPHPAIAANVQRFLDAIRARRLWSGYFGMTLAPDSNVNAASSDRVIYIFGLPFLRDADSTAKSGTGIVIWGGGEYQHPLSDRIRLRAGTDFSHTEHRGKDFDQTFLSVHAGPRWLIGNSAEASVLASVRRYWSDGNPNWTETGVRFEVERQLTSQLAALGRVSWHQRRYAGNRSLKGPHAALSVGTHWQVNSTTAVDAHAGLTTERPASVNARNSGYWFRLGVSLALQKGFTVGMDGELRRTNFKGNWTPFTPDGVSRKDRTRILRASVLHRGYTAYGFSPKLLLVSEARKSNAQLHDYRRNRAELHFVRQF